MLFEASSNILQDVADANRSFHCLLPYQLNLSVVDWSYCIIGLNTTHATAIAFIVWEKLTLTNMSLISQQNDDAESSAMWNLVK